MSEQREEGWYVTEAGMMRYWRPGTWSAPCWQDDDEVRRERAKNTVGESTPNVVGGRVCEPSTFEAIARGLGLAMRPVEVAWAAIPEQPRRANQQTADAAFLEQLSDIMWERMTPRAVRVREIAHRIASGFYHG